MKSKTVERLMNAMSQETKDLVDSQVEKTMAKKKSQWIPFKVNRYRIKKAYECYVNGREHGRNAYWSFRLSLWWFSSGFSFAGDQS